MPSLKGIRKRIVSTKSTQKITRAMKMVAGAKLTRAQQRIVAMRPESKALYVVLTADRGLCGALNTNVNKATERAWREKEAAGATVAFVTAGRKGREYLARRGGKVSHDFARIY